MVGKAIRPSTFDAGKVNVAVMLLVLAAAKTVFALSHSIFQFMKQVVLGEKA